ncbi:aminoglycoside phosphotransferase family protein [Actinoplanes sp. TRM 88003]|uniref:Aminoglycoside phosphotransferase family protein n=1 Tax=Paractinoplanes aksuensis TaxID=2939490 RepID=A0ABT1E1J2_9ACTN|nr:phosphotransferase [Actinoplanes aksuensis]MCO8277008.1 aminoglycoside phosphotransferase family protein [Actinoplanes aksuensis]
MTRTVTLVLVSPDGELLGETEPFQPASPWWQPVDDFGPGLQVLRLLHSDKAGPPGGHVTYLAELIDEAANIRKIGRQTTPPPSSPGESSRPYFGNWSEPHAKRAAYAERGGPSASIAWATSLVPGTTAHQCRTWNLSAIWRLDDARGNPVAWLKQVPRFFVHEPYAIRLVDSVAPGLVPRLIADGADGRMLLAHAPGADRYGAGADLCGEIAAAFHPVQAHFAADPAALARIPDARLGKTLGEYVRIAEPFYDGIPGLREFVADLPRRFAEIAECGLPDTLVHGDLHPGNVRTDDAGRITIMDWGDCVLGHPALDILRLTDADTNGSERGPGLPGRERLLAAWADRWRQTVPGSDPVRAVALMRPVADLRGALIYSEFLENIEPTEWPYHATDVPEGLAAAVEAARA